MTTTIDATPQIMETTIAETTTDTTMETPTPPKTTTAPKMPIRSAKESKTMNDTIMDKNKEDCDDGNDDDKDEDVPVETRIWIKRSLMMAARLPRQRGNHRPASGITPTTTSTMTTTTKTASTTMNGSSSSHTAPRRGVGRTPSTENKEEKETAVTTATASTTTTTASTTTAPSSAPAATATTKTTTASTWSSRRRAGTAAAATAAATGAATSTAATGTTTTKTPPPPRRTRSGGGGLAQMLERNRLAASRDKQHHSSSSVVFDDADSVVSALTTKTTATAPPASMLVVTSDEDASSAQQNRSLSSTSHGSNHNRTNHTSRPFVQRGGGTAGGAGKSVVKVGVLRSKSDELSHGLDGTPSENGSADHKPSFLRKAVPKGNFNLPNNKAAITANSNSSKVTSTSPKPSKVTAPRRSRSGGLASLVEQQHEQPHEQQPLQDDNNNNNPHLAAFAATAAAMENSMSSFCQTDDASVVSVLTVKTTATTTTTTAEEDPSLPAPPPPSSLLVQQPQQQQSQSQPPTQSTDKQQQQPPSTSSPAQPAVPAMEPYEWAVAWMTRHTSDGSVTVRLDPAELVEGSTKILETMTFPADAKLEEKGQVLLANPLPGKHELVAPHDLTTVQHFHEPTVVECLQRRYAAGHIYTATGPVLLALNPFDALPDLYNQERMEAYWTRAEQGVVLKKAAPRVGELEPMEEEILPPHVYAIADNAFRNMMRGIQMERHSNSYIKNKNGNPESSSREQQQQHRRHHQSILVSGESGAGKTVTTKYIMKYLAALSQRATMAATVGQRAYRHSGAKTSSSGNDPSRGSRRLSSSTNTLSSSSSSSIEAQVLQSNPILEAFGNARTVRNDNSSRFGKFIQMQFQAAGRLLGTCIETYLLEKVRVVHQNPGERNYHVFYQLLSINQTHGSGNQNFAEEDDEEEEEEQGDEHQPLHAGHNRDSATAAMTPTSAAAQLSQRLFLQQRRPEEFRILAQSGTFERRDGVSDVETYRDLCRAMRMMKWSPDEQDDVRIVTAAVLHASNLTFCPTSSPSCYTPTGRASVSGNSQGHCSTTEACGLVRDNPHLEATCTLLQVTADALNEALCWVTREARGQVIRSPLRMVSAQKGLDALLQATYGALFAYLVQRVNASIAFIEIPGAAKGEGAQAQQKPCSVIGVLDIFGFESFPVNSFEQMCINYCNEVLQQQFNTYMLKNEQAEYAAQGLDWSFIKFPENQDVLDLLEHKTAGILSILDDMCRAPGATDKVFAQEVVKRCESLPAFSQSSKAAIMSQFSIHHYAGVVEYTADGFVEKNRNELPKETCELLLNSKSPFVQTLARMMMVGSHQPAQSGGSSTSGGAPKTVGGHFRQQVRDLREKIDGTHPHYVRCIKPNAALLPRNFDATMVAHQLRCGGILQAVSVTRDGFTLHYTHDDFLKRYGVLVYGTKPRPKSKARPTARELEQECQAVADVLLKRIANNEEEGRRPASTQQQLQSQNGKAESKAKADTTPSNEEHMNGHGQVSASEPAESPPCNAAAAESVPLSEILIQMGKTKVLLKHHAFESLERMLIVLHNACATRINALLRRAYCRNAFLLIREAFRAELARHNQTFAQWFAEHRELYYRPRIKDKKSMHIPNLVSHRKAMFAKAAAASNPTPSNAPIGRGGAVGNKYSRNKKTHGLSMVIHLHNQPWIVYEGLWKRNPDYKPPPPVESSVVGAT